MIEGAGLDLELDGCKRLEVSDNDKQKEAGLVRGRERGSLSDPKYVPGMGALGVRVKCCLS